MGLTKTEFSVVERFIANHASLLTPTQSEREFLRYVASRTLRFHKYHERIPAGDFISGSRVPQHLLPWGFRFSQGTFYRSRKGLQSRGLLDYEGRGVVWYRLNLPGILGGFIRAAHRLNDTQTVTMLAPLLDKTTKAYQEQGWVCDEIELDGEAMTKIEDKVRTSLETSKRLAKKVIEDAMKKWRDGNTRWIRPKMEEWAEEAGLKFEDTWTGREAKSAKNFLKYCAEENRDPHEWLYQVCINWLRIKRRLELMEFPHKRFLSKVVSFSEYFNSRRYIDKVLSEILAAPKREVEVISMEAAKERLRGKQS